MGANKKKLNNIDVDNLLTNLKPRGRFQVTQYLLLASSFIACATSFSKIVYIANVPETTCKDLSQSQLYVFGYVDNASDSITYNSCHIEIYNQNSSKNETIPCINGYNYSIRRDQSFVSEWDLVCGQEYLSELSQTLCSIGCLVGAIVISVLSDKYGRKPAHFISFLFLLINEIAIVFVKDYWLFALFRFTEGIFNYGMVMPAYLAMLEIFPGHARTPFSAATGIIWAFSMLLLTPLAYLCRNATWRIVCLVFGLMATTCFIEFWFVEESIRWLVTNNKIEETRKIVKKAARQNGVNFEEVWEKCVESCKSLVPMMEKDNDEEAVEIEESLGYTTLFTDPLARKISLILVYNSLMCSLTYYGIYMTTIQLAGNYYLNLFLTSLMEVFGNVFMLFMFTKFQRRTTIIFFEVLSGTSLLAAVLITFAFPNSPTTTLLNKIFTLFGMFGISASFNLIWLYAPEIYPTNLRNSGLGLMGVGDSFANMISPFSRLTARHISWLPSTIFGVGIILGSLMLFSLPESKNTQMPTTMEDVRVLNRKTPSKNWIFKKDKMKNIIQNSG